MIYIGIDPGLSGCICSYNDVTKTFEYYDDYILKIKGKSEYDITVIKNIIRDINPGFACIERQHAMPGQGVTSMFKIGYGYGMMLGLLTALSVPYMITQAKAWQQTFFSSTGKDTKDESYKAATQRYPEITNLLKGPEVV